MGGQQKGGTQGTLAEHAETKSGEGIFIRIASVNKDGAISQQRKSWLPAGFLTRHVALKCYQPKLVKAEDVLLLYSTSTLSVH